MKDSGSFGCGSIPHGSTKKLIKIYKTLIKKVDNLIGYPLFYTYQTNIILQI